MAVAAKGCYGPCKMSLNVHLNASVLVITAHYQAEICIHSCPSPSNGYKSHKTLCLSIVGVVQKTFLVIFFMKPDITHYIVIICVFIDELPCACTRLSDSP